MLREAIAEARAAGLDTAASDLERACFEAAFTTVSEEFCEHGVAIRRFLKATGGVLPRPIRAKLKDCLTEIDRVWPGWRKLVALLRRRRVPG